MSEKKNRTRVEFGPGGDTTNGPISLSEITTVDRGLLRLIGLVRPDDSQQAPSPEPQQNIPPASHPTFELGESSMLPNPDELQKQMTRNQSQPLASSQKTIESLKAEILKLKYQLFHIKNASGKDLENFDIEDLKQDLITDLKNRNKQLKKQLEERDKKDRREEERKRNLKNSEAQTNLDSSNIDELLRDRITLKRITEQRLQTNQASSHTYQQPQQFEHHQQQSQAQYSSLPHHHQYHQQQAHHHQFQRHRQQQPQPNPQHQHPPHAQQPEHEQHQIMSQLHYPSVTLAKQMAATKKLAPDEKEILEILFRVDGCMTTALDKLKAVSDIR